MTKYVEKMFNIATGEETIRPYTAEEIAEVEEAQRKAAKVTAERDADQATRDADRAALLSKLGITADEAKLLLG